MKLHSSFVPNRVQSGQYMSNVVEARKIVHNMNINSFRLTIHRNIKSIMFHHILIIGECSITLLMFSATVCAAVVGELFPSSDA